MMVCWRGAILALWSDVVTLWQYDDTGIVVMAVRYGLKYNGMIL